MEALYVIKEGHQHQKIMPDYLRVNQSDRVSELY